MSDLPSTEAIAAFYAIDRQSGESSWQEHSKNLQRFGRILTSVERFVRPGRFLDIGCSIGTSLVVARERGWQAIGLELSRPAAEFGSKEWGLDIRSQTLADAAFAPGSFDAVLMHHTLEHIERPDELMAQVREVLAPGGVTYQSLPNHGSLKAKILGRYFGYGVTDEHISHFSRRTLEKLLRRVGFDIVDSQTWSYAQDPRLLYDMIRRLGLEARFMRRIGKPGQPLDAATYLDYLHNHKWAYWFCNGMWPQRLVSALKLGEDLHVVARRRD